MFQRLGRAARGPWRRERRERRRRRSRRVGAGQTKQIQSPFKCDLTILEKPPTFTISVNTGSKSSSLPSKKG